MKFIVRIVRIPNPYSQYGAVRPPTPATTIAGWVETHDFLRLDGVTVQRMALPGGLGGLEIFQSEPQKHIGNRAPQEVNHGYESTAALEMVREAFVGRESRSSYHTAVVTVWPVEPWPFTACFPSVPEGLECLSQGDGGFATEAQEREFQLAYVAAGGAEVELALRTRGRTPSGAPLAIE